MAWRTIIDGNLLADCERHGKIRFGMYRVAEEITKRLAGDPELKLYLANTRQTSEEDRLLRSYRSKLTANGKINILSYPFAGYPIPSLHRVSAKISRQFFAGSFSGIGHYDLFHSFYFPFSKSIQKARIKKSITLLDIIPLRMDGYPQYMDHIKAIVQSIESNSAIAISQYSKDDLCDYDRRISPEQIFVVPLAASKESFYVNRDKEAWKGVKEKYGLPENYFLSIAGFDKRKNLEHLIYSFDQFVLQEKPDDLHLVMTGSSAYSKEKFLQLDIAPETRKRIVLSQPIEEPDLSVVYSNAVCFFFMSVYEGFGLPVLEAMQCGIPVVTSNVTSLPEVVGDAGIMLSPYDQEALSDTMLRVYTDSRLRDRMAAMGLARAAQFSWERCAQEYSAIFKKIISL